MSACAPGTGSGMRKSCPNGRIGSPAVGASLRLDLAVGGAHSLRWRHHAHPSRRHHRCRSHAHGGRARRADQPRGAGAPAVWENSKHVATVLWYRQDGPGNFTYQTTTVSAKGKPAATSTDAFAG